MHFKCSYQHVLSIRVGQIHKILDFMYLTHPTVHGDWSGSEVDNKPESGSPTSQPGSSVHHKLAEYPSGFAAVKPATGMCLVTSQMCPVTSLMCLVTSQQADRLTSACRPPLP